MAKFRLSRRAEADLLGIGEFTLREWGKSQAGRYIGELESCCQMLADNPALGRPCDHVRPGLRRHEHGKHVLFYRQQGVASWCLAFCTNACYPTCTKSNDRDTEA